MRCAPRPTLRRRAPRGLQSDPTLDPSTALAAPRGGPPRRPPPAGGRRTARRRHPAALGAQARRAPIRQALEASELGDGARPPARARDEGRALHGSGVVALSYVAARPAASAAAGAPAARVVDVRARQGGGFFAGDTTMQTADFGVFIDFMSMFRPTTPPARCRVHEAGRAGVVRPRAAQHRPALRPRRQCRVQDDGDAAAGRRRARSRLRPARVVPPRAAPRRPRGAGDEPRRVGVADGRGRARRAAAQRAAAAAWTTGRRGGARRSGRPLRRPCPGTRARSARGAARRAE